MSDFTTPEPDAPEAAIEPVAPVAPVAAPIEAKPKAKRKRRKAVKKRAPRTKKVDPNLASKQASDTPSRYPVSESARPLAEVGAAGHPPAAPLQFSVRAARALRTSSRVLNLQSYRMGTVDQIVLYGAVVVLMATGAYACSFFG